MGAVRLLLSFLVLLAAGCGDGSESLTVYFPQRLGPEGPHGQRVPVLMPVERDPRETMSPVRQAVLELMAGPAPGERSRGFEDVLSPGTRADHVEIRDGVVEIDLAGPEPDFLGSAAIVYSETELAGVERVRLLRDGKPCCVYTMQSTPWPTPLTRQNFRRWTGEPCALRTYADAVHCRR
jgi:spore germination protein GerM